MFLLITRINYLISKLLFMNDFVCGVMKIDKAGHSSYALKLRHHYHSISSSFSCDTSLYTHLVHSRSCLYILKALLWNTDIHILIKKYAKLLERFFLFSMSWPTSRFDLFISVSAE